MLEMLCDMLLARIGLLEAKYVRRPVTRSSSPQQTMRPGHPGASLYADLCRRSCVRSQGARCRTPSLCVGTHDFGRFERSWFQSSERILSNRRRAARVPSTPRCAPLYVGVHWMPAGGATHVLADAKPGHGHVVPQRDCKHVQGASGRSRVGPTR